MTRTSTIVTAHDAKPLPSVPASGRSPVYWKAVFALAASEEFWALITSVLIQDLSWDTRSRHAHGGLTRGPLQGGGERGLSGSQTAQLCHTLRCHAVVLEVCALFFFL